MATDQLSFWTRPDRVQRFVEEVRTSDSLEVPNDYDYATQSKAEQLVANFMELFGC